MNEKFSQFPSIDSYTIGIEDCLAILYPKQDLLPIVICLKHEWENCTNWVPIYQIAKFELEGACIDLKNAPMHHGMFNFNLVEHANKVGHTLYYGDLELFVLDYWKDSGTAHLLVNYDEHGELLNNGAHRKIAAVDVTDCGYISFVRYKDEYKCLPRNNSMATFEIKLKEKEQA